MNIAQQENADVFICEMSALLHDIADEKLTHHDDGIDLIKHWLAKCHVSESDSLCILFIIGHMSFG